MVDLSLFEAHVALHGGIPPRVLEAQGLCEILVLNSPGRAAHLSDVRNQNTNSCVLENL